MCNPAAVMVMQGLGSVQGAMGSIAEGDSKNSYYQYLASQNEKQIPEVLKTSNLNTGIVSSAAARDESNLSRSVASLKGTQKAVQAANGVWGGSATASDIERDTNNKAELDRAAIRENANLRSQAIAKGAKDDIAGLRSQANQLRMAGSDAIDASRTNAASSLLTGATQVASNWYKWKQTSRGRRDPLEDVYGGI